MKSLDAAKIYETLGLTVDHVETVETQKVKTAFLSVGDSHLERVALSFKPFSDLVFHVPLAPSGD